MAEDGVRVLSADDRFRTWAPGISTWHCFSHGVHYDPANVAYGRLRAVNEEQVEPGAGYAAHRHVDVEILTWVLDGVLEHHDSAGHQQLLRPGTVQHLSAGSGVEHTERNPSGSQPLRFVQMLLAPSAAQLTAAPAPPTLRQVEVEGSRGRLLRALTVGSDAVLHVAMLDACDTVALPTGGTLHLHVTRGQVEVGAQPPASVRLSAGDTARVSSASATGLTAAAASEIVVWHQVPTTDSQGEPR